MTAAATRIKTDQTQQDQLISWIVDQGLRGTESDRVFDGFCIRMQPICPILRGYCAMRVLHPNYSGFGHVWRRDDGVTEENYGRVPTNPTAWAQSPMRLMVEEGIPELRRPISGPDDCKEFPVFEDFRSEGATDYFALTCGHAAEGFADGAFGIFFSWTTDAASGFSDTELAFMRRVLPVLALTMRVAVTRRISFHIAGAYLGRDAGRRVLAGEVERGQVETISAVLLYGDLSGFTALADSMPSEALVEMLNEYLTCMAEPVEQRGGQVLKFMGDGMLSTFEIDSADDESHGRSETCAAALDAALEALTRVSAVNAIRRDKHQPTMPLNLALHLGDVLYGNVGSPDRLDFTIIGPAVNEASRMEAMCGPLERNLLISKAFADAVSTVHDVELLPLGKHGLRSVREPVHLYTIAEAPEL